MNALTCALEFNMEHRSRPSSRMEALQSQSVAATKPFFNMERDDQQIESHQWGNTECTGGLRVFLILLSSLDANIEAVAFNLLGSMFISTLGVHGDDFKAIKASPRSSSLRSLKLGSAPKNQ